MTDSAQPTTPPCVELDGDRVVVHELAVEGHRAELVAAASTDGAASVVRDALDIGSAVLLHGVAKSTVDAVASEVDRVLTALRERRSSLVDVGRIAERVSAKGFAYEEELGRALERNFAHADVAESTGLTPGIADDKTGDYVATLDLTETAGRALRVVIEAKAQALSMPKTQEELDNAMLNRGAVVGIVVFRSQPQLRFGGRSAACPGNASSASGRRRTVTNSPWRPQSKSRERSPSVPNAPMENLTASSG